MRETLETRTFRPRLVSRWPINDESTLTWGSHCGNDGEERGESGCGELHFG
jgi:hypothetical protein